MKKILLLSVLVALLTACSTTSLTPAEKEAKQTRKARIVLSAVEQRRFIVEMDYIHPNRVGSHPLSYGFSFEVRGDSVFSYLPYFGRAYSIPYGGGRGLNFSAPIQNYKIKVIKGDGLRVTIDVRNIEDSYRYVMDVYSNGNATLDVMPRQRESISFSGNMVFKDKNNKDI